MTEKQASSEIAQSRERFRKFLVDQQWPFSRQAVIAAMEWAELDTRERIVQIAKDIAKEVGGNFSDTHRLNVDLNKFIKELERIRGKE